MKRAQLPLPNYEADMHIDENALDVEWLNHGNITIKYIRLLANQNKLVKKLTERKKTLRSELTLRAINDPVGTIGKTSATGPAIEAYYRADPEYQKVVDELIEAEYELEFIEMAKNEICFTRKQALSELVQLHGQMYFAGPAVPRDLAKERKAWQKAQEEKVAARIAERLNGRRHDGDETGWQPD